LAKVALGNDARSDIRRDDPVGADQDACPAAAALVWIDRDSAGVGVLAHCAGEAGVDAGRVGAVTTLHRQEETVGSLHADAGHWPRALSLERLDQVLRGGMGKSAVDLAEATSHADAFLNIYPTHHTYPIHEWRAATGCRLPLVSHTPRNLSIPAGT
jgi:hypothetical protein